MDCIKTPSPHAKYTPIRINDPESAYSSIIGVLLLITIVMMMGGIVSLVLTSQPVPEKVPMAYLSVSQTHERIDLLNKAGDTLTSKTVAIVVDGVDRTNMFRKPENSPDWETLRAGEHIYYDSPTEPESVQVVYTGNSGQYLLASVGPASGTPIIKVPSPTPVPTIAVAQKPTVIRITPDSGFNNSCITSLDIAGTAFLPGASVFLNGSGFADIPATDVTVISPAQITCSFNFTDEPAGFRNVVVTNSNGDTGMLTGGFRVDPAGDSRMADFVATPTTGTAPLSVQFNDTSLSSPARWEWTFGDGEKSDMQNVSHQYTTTGTYTVNLTVANADGSYRTVKTDYINVTSRNSIASLNPVANFTSNVTEIPVNGFVQFSDTSSNTPTHWQWTFGDDLFYDTQQNPVHQYINPGMFSVQLTVTNADGTDSEFRTNYIQVVKGNHPPVLTPIPNYTATSGIPLTFTLTGSDLDNDHLTYSADGLPPGAAFDPATRTFTWTPGESDAGNYLSTFTVSDGTSADSETGRIMVTSVPKIPPTAQFTSDVKAGQSPLTVQFTDQSTGTAPLTYHWDFSDGSGNLPENSLQNPSWRFWENDAPSFTVTLTVTNAYGSDTIVKQNYITFDTTPSPGPVAAFTSNIQSGTAPLTVRFTDQSTGTPQTYTWDFNNDKITDSTVKNPSFTFATPGNYTVNLTVTNANGKDNEIKSEYIRVSSPGGTPMPTAQFTANTTVGKAPLTIQFTDISDSTGTTSYQWDINNDGVTDYTAKNPVHTYQAAGTYSVKLTVNNASGSDSETKTNYISLSSLQSGECFGAEACNPTGNPIGGGAGYSKTISGTEAGVKYVVSTNAELIAALKSAKSGETVFVRGTAVIDLTGTPGITIPAGVTLASDRGRAGSAGGLLKRTENVNGGWEEPMFIVGGDNVRVTGLRLEGEMYPQDYGNKAGETYENDYLVGIYAENRKGFEVDNCELYGWAWSCISLRQNNIAPAPYIHHNYIHHNQARGEGYGVNLYGGNALIEANLFDYNRHDVTGAGMSGEQYEARYNRHLGHGNPIGATNYDVHQDEETGTGLAGNQFKIHHNTIDGGIIAMLQVRGMPQTGMYVDHNIINSVASDTGVTGNKPIFQTSAGTGNMFVTQNYWKGTLYQTDNGIVVYY